MINVIFSMNGPRLTSEQAGSFSQFAQWIVLHERNGRLLVDGIGKSADVAGVMTTLAQMGRAPITIGAWDQDGTNVTPVNVAAWLDAAPDVIDVTDPQKPVSKRPTGFAEIHQWAGWAPK